MKKLLTLFTIAALVSGCWTFSESPYPSFNAVRANGAMTNLVLRVEGFAATVTQYTSVEGFSTVYVPGHFGRYHCHPGGFETVHSCTYVPTVHATDMFLKRAKEEFEDLGFVLVSGAAPDYVVEVDFAPVAADSGDAAACWAWRLCTLFFCDYEMDAWTANLRVRNNRTGRLLFHETLMQRYETKVFGLIPLFGFGSCAETTSERMKGWCLAALTDRVVARVSAALASNRPSEAGQVKLP